LLKKIQIITFSFVLFFLLAIGFLYTFSLGLLVGAFGLTLIGIYVINMDKIVVEPINNKKYEKIKPRLAVLIPVSIGFILILSTFLAFIYLAFNDPQFIKIDGYGMPCSILIAWGFILGVDRLNEGKREFDHQKDNNIVWR
jgi:hypothetical protein